MTEDDRRTSSSHKRKNHSMKDLPKCTYIQFVITTLKPCRKQTRMNEPVGINEQTFQWDDNLGYKNPAGFAQSKFSTWNVSDLVTSKAHGGEGKAVRPETRLDASWGLTVPVSASFTCCLAGVGRLHFELLQDQPFVVRSRKVHARHLLLL